MLRKKENLIGIMFILLSAIGFSSLQLIVKMLPDIGIGTKLFFRNSIITVISYFIIKSNNINFKVEKSEWKILTVRIFFGIIGIVINFYTIMFILVSDSNIIQKTSTFIMIILSYIFLGEKILKEQLFAIIISFLGIILIVKPSSNFSFAYILAFIGSICAAISYTSIRYLGLRKKVDASLIVFYFSLISSISFMPYLFIEKNIYTIKSIILLILIGLFGVLGQYGITYAYKYAAAKDISIFEYFQVIFSSILAYIFLKEIPDKYSFIGYILVISSALFLFIIDRKKI